MMMLSRDHRARVSALEQRMSGIEGTFQTLQKSVWYLEAHAQRQEEQHKQNRVWLMTIAGTVLANFLVNHGAYIFRWLGGA
jgi:hypothetical protein